MTSVPTESPLMIRLRRGKFCLSGGVPDGKVGDERPVAGEDLAGQPRVFAWVDHIEAAAEHGNRSTLAPQGAPVGGRIDAERQAARDAETHANQLFGELMRGIAAERGRIAAADDRELRHGQRSRIAFHEQYERSVRDLAEQAGIVIGAPCNQFAAGTACEPGRADGDLHGIRSAQRADDGGR